MVLEAIFGEDYVAGGEADQDARVKFHLWVNGEDGCRSDGSIYLWVDLTVTAYPSHAPPGCRVVEGESDTRDIAFVEASLQEIFFAQRNAREEGEEPVGIVHAWTEWLRDEWIAKRPPK